MPVNVITIKWGDNLYGPHYVNRLYAGVQRNLSAAFRFVCFTDNSQGIRPEVEVYPLPEINLEAATHFNEGRKLGLFQSGIGDLEGPCLYFDLDVIIVRSIDCFFEYLPGKFCVCREWLPPNKRLLNRFFNNAIGMNTSIFRFEADSMQFVVDRMNEDTTDLEKLLNLSRIGSPTLWEIKSIGGLQSGQPASSIEDLFIHSAFSGHPYCPVKHGSWYSTDH